MGVNDPYELGPEEFYFDMLLPMIPFVGLIAIPIGMIDMGSSIQRVQTQGKVRVMSALLGQGMWIAAICIAAMV